MVKTGRRLALKSAVLVLLSMVTSVVARAQEAKAHLTVLPEGSVRTALANFADIVATRSA